MYKSFHMEYIQITSIVKLYLQVYINNRIHNYHNMTIVSSNHQPNLTKPNLA